MPSIERHTDRRVGAPRTHDVSGHRRRREEPRNAYGAGLSGTQLVRGTVLRITDLPVPIREHQSGGTPIHAVPTRRAHHAPRPPPVLRTQ